MDYTIIYNGGKGKMTLHCEKFFARNDKGKLHIAKPDIYKTFRLINEWCDSEQVGILLKWLKTHKCADLAEYYEKKYGKYE